MPLDTFCRGFGAAILLGSVHLAPIAGQAEGLRYSVRLYAGATTSPFDKDEPMVGVPDFLIEGERRGATPMDQKLAVYTHGVKPSEAGGGVSADRVKEACIPSIGIEATFALSEKATSLGAVSAALLPNSMTSSPIVKRDALVPAMIGVRYAI